ncbi:glycosyltransferase family 4 protein [Actinophytocola algeriensis]|uniref:Glycosyltransferase involved in cell wall biosynthesis n=1 Tax=Actinophytocola algeriensis TaxID=1768010 RepID=A0A7W7Q1Z0_9PSEU|nr:glycosyltransferase family 4 protein [Actinophytocola algeriensis]MBB4905514.1 glycosyltransferase involved in cell wall biosynthesis [Actinophytocola algeriensis]MBE1472801.1 glycosyltransferase involved in cell wall biosynthesis [Actinophytocola algeriensis]
MTPFVVPADIDDVTVASGGNTYDRRMCDLLGLDKVPVAGRWPTPSTKARVALADTLAEIPDGSVALIDGLVACGVPEVVVPHTRRLKLVVLLHLQLADETGVQPERAAGLDRREREVLRAASAVVATSEWAARRAIAHHGLDPKRVRTAPPGTDPAPRAAGTDAGDQLLCLASVTQRKGHDVLAQALANLADLPWTCVCVGSVRRDPGHARRVQGLVDKLGISNKMIIAGPLPDADLDATFAKTDLLVLPSRRETFGMVITEALVRGIPVLTTNVDALPHTLGPGTSSGGMLVPADDVPALTAALRRWLTDAELRERLREAARARVVEDWPTAAKRLAGVLR